ncbi:10520_t:CDS:1, partial [Racocetra persica]
PSNSSVREKPYKKKFRRFQESSFAVTQDLCRTFPTSFSSDDVKNRHESLVEIFVEIYYD